MLGITFVVSGLVQFLRIFIDRIQPRSILYFFIAALYCLFGVVYWIHPILSMLSMGLILMGFLMVDGLAKFVLAYEVYPSKISIGFVLNGILSMTLAGLIWKSWPSTAFWVPGAFSGLNLLFYGSSLLSLVLSEPRRRHRRADG